MQAKHALNACGEVATFLTKLGHNLVASLEREGSCGHGRRERESPFVCNAILEGRLA